MIAGASASWVWAALAASVPAAVLLDHGDHTLLVPWAPVPGVRTGALFTLDSLQPLTVEEPVICGICGLVGLITDGRWVLTGSVPVEASRG